MKKIIQNTIDKIASQRVSVLVEPILPWFTKNSGDILDFGCGLGHLAHSISKETNRVVTYLDVRKYPFSCKGCEIEVFDGKLIPYQPNHFDTSLAAFVLHHVPDPETSLREIIRVTQHEIIICEDHLLTRKEIITEGVKDTIANCFLPHMTMKYKIESEWENLFTKLGLIIEDKVCFSSRYIFNFNHIAWRLFKS